MLNVLNTKIPNIIYDENKLQNKYFPDLVSNEVFFYQLISDYKIKYKDEIKDDSNEPISTPSIDDLKYEIIQNPSKFVGKEIIVTCPISYMYTSDEKLGKEKGPDRLHLLPKDKTKLIGFLNDNGYVSTKSPVLEGKVRWIWDNGKLIGFTISKQQGNGRIFMKQYENRGAQNLSMSIKLTFHDLNPKLTTRDYVSIESKSFHSDAQDRRAMSVETRAISGLMAGEKEYVRLANFLDKMNVDFSEIVKYLRQTNGKKIFPKYELTSIMGLSYSKSGKEKADFRFTTEEDFKNAFDVVIKIMDARQKGDFDKKIVTSRVRVISRLFATFCHQITSNLKTHQPLLSEKELTHIIEQRYTSSRKLPNNKVAFEHDFSEIDMGARKDLWYQGVNSGLVNHILTDIEAMRDNRENKIRSSNPHIKSYLDNIHQEWRQEAINIIDKRQ